MVTKELLDFLTAQHSGGMTRAQMKNILVVQGGWEASDVEEAFHELGIEAPVSPPPPPQIKAPAAPDPAPKVLEVAREVKQPPEEDFLGILAPSISQKYPEQAPSLDQVLLPVTMPQEKQVEKQEEKEATAQISAPATSLEQPQVKPVLVEKSLSPQSQEKAPEQSPSSTSVIQFNLAAIKDISTLPSAAPIVTQPAAASAPVQAPAAAPLTEERQPEKQPEKPAEKQSEKQVLSKNIETKSGAAMWLSGMTEKQGGTQANGEPEKPSAGSKYPPRPGVRSMSQDILLRGRGSTVPGMPAMTAPMTKDEILMTQTPEQKAKIEKEKELKEQKEQKERKAAEETAKKAASAALRPPADIAKKQRTKRTIAIAVAGVIFLLLAGGAFAAFTLVRGPDAATLLSDSFLQFTGSQSFAYKSSASSSIMLSSSGNGVVRKGNVNFSLAMSGALKNSIDGFGDGNHHIEAAGALQSGDYHWATDIESDFRMLGSILYFHVTSYPSQNDLDPEVFKTYWIEIDVPEIVKELAPSSGAVSADDYGNLAGGSDRDSSFSALLAKDMPWKGGANVGTENINGVEAEHIRLTTDKDALYRLATDLYKKYSGKTLTLDADAEIRLTDALAKTVFEVWIDPKTKTMLKFSLYGDYNDDIFGVHAEGPLALSIEFSQYNAPVEVALPQPLMTLDDLKVRMDDHKKVSAFRARDAAKVNAIGEIGLALKDYYGAHGKYPATLSDLRKSGAISTSTVPDALYKEAVYAAYIDEGDYTKANKCTPKSKVCGVYHIGVNFEDPTDPALTGDADVASDIHGADDAGCAGEKNFSCYDVLTSERGNAELPAAH